LLLLAIADDLCGVIIIAAFYPNPHHPFAAEWLLLVVVGMVSAYGMRRLGIQNWKLYVAGPSMLSWIGLLGSAVHLDVAIVLIVPFLPATTKDAIAEEGVYANAAGDDLDPITDEKVWGKSASRSSS
jgi:NhaA family Na+:H+ antiporter